MAIQFIADAVATGTGSTITWTIPAHNVGDLILLSFRSASSSTTSTMTTPPSGYTMIFDRRRSTGPYPTWCFGKIATGSDAASATISVSAGWRAVAVVIRGAKQTNPGSTYDMVAEAGASHVPGANTITVAAGSGETASEDGCMHLIIGMARLAASGTCVVTDNPSITITETEDSYLSNLHTYVGYGFPTSLVEHRATITMSTSNANTTELSMWRFMLEPEPTNIQGTMAPSMDAMTASNTADVEVYGTSSGILPEMTSTTTADVKIPATMDAGISEMSSENTAEVVVVGEMSGGLPEITSETTADIELYGVMDAALPELESTATGNSVLTYIEATLSALLPSMESSASGDVVVSGALHTELPGLDATIASDAAVYGSMAPEMGEADASGTGVLRMSGATDSDLPEMGASTTASVTISSRSYDIPQGSMTVVYVDSEEMTFESAPGSNVLDGLTNTIWHTGYAGGDDPIPHEIHIDLGSVVTVREIRYLPRQFHENGRIANYEVYTSFDGSLWELATSGTWLNSTAEQSAVFSPRGTRFVRIRAVTEVNGNQWTAMAEFNAEADGFGASMPAMDSASTGAAVVSGSLDATMEPPTATADGSISGSGTLHPALPEMFSQVVADVVIGAVYAAELPEFYVEMGAESTLRGPRVRKIPADDRTLIAYEDDRENLVPAYEFVFVVFPESRVYVVQPESRTVYAIGGVNV